MYSSGSFLELLTGAVAWGLYAELWGILVRTGIAYLPFAGLIFAAFRRIAAEGEGKGNLDVLRDSEFRLYTAFAVILLMAVPLVALRQGEFVYPEQSCVMSASDAKRELRQRHAGDSGSTYDRVYNDGKSVRVPLWWWLVNNFGQGITAVAINALPCTVDVHELRTDAASSVIEHPQLREETGRFERECWHPAYRRFMRTNRTDVREDYKGRPLHRDISWIGSRFFVNETAFYESTYPQKAVAAFPYEKSRDEIFATREFSGQGGWPNCRDWWEDGHSGLRKRLLATVDAGLFTRWNAYFSGKAGSPEERILQAILRSDSKVGRRVITDNYRPPGNWNVVMRSVSNVLGTYSLATSLPEIVLGFKVLRDSAPILQSILLMLIVISLPFILIISGYRLEVVLTMSFVFFSIILWSFLFKMIYWLDNTFSQVLFPDTWTGAAVSAPFFFVFQSVLFGLYVILPVLLTRWLGEVGKGAGVGVAQVVIGALSERVASARMVQSRAQGGRTRRNRA